MKHYTDDMRNFNFQSVDVDSVKVMIKKFDPKESTWCWCDDIPGKLPKLLTTNLGIRVAT